MSNFRPELVRSFNKISKYLLCTRLKEYTISTANSFSGQGQSRICYDIKNSLELEVKKNPKGGVKVQNWRRLKDLQTDCIRVNLEKLMPGLISSVVKV